MNSREAVETLYRTARQSEPSATDRETLDRLDDDDWSTLIAFARRQCSAVDLYCGLIGSGFIDRVPSNARVALSGYQWAGEESEARLRREVAALSEVMSRCEIDFALLKGAAIICGGYAGAMAGQRPLVDIDILVKPSDLDRTYDCLVDAGYLSSVNVPRPLNDRWLDKHLPPMLPAGYTFPIEVHQRLTEHQNDNNYLFDTESLFTRSRNIDLGDCKVCIPCPEHLFISAFYHVRIGDYGELEGGGDVRAMIDCANLVKHSAEFDWALVRQLADSRGIADSLRLFCESTARFIDRDAETWLPDVKVSRWKRLRYALARRHPRVARFTVVSLRFLHTIQRVSSTTGRSHRQALARANPSDPKYQPVWKQLINPHMLRDRLNFFVELIRK